jgi:predicted TIM-barrel fold metal-dependent hydrolase
MIQYEDSLIVEDYAKKFPKLDIITTVGRKFLFEENLNLIEGAKIIQV